MHNSKTIGCMNVLHMQWMLYYGRSSFYGFELHASYEWWTTAPNMHHGLFPICHFVPISSITRKPQGAYNSTSHQMTSLPPRMLCFMLKVAKQLKPTSYRPIQTLLSCYFVSKYKSHQNPGCVRLCYNRVTTTFLPRLHFLEIQNEVWLTSCHPAAIAVSLNNM